MFPITGICPLRSVLIPENLPPHVEEAVRSIGQLHADHEKRLTPFRRAVEHMTGLLGSPTFIVLLTCVLVAWVGGI
jgi:uncharacterized membrane protein